MAWWYFSGDFLVLWCDDILGVISCLEFGIYDFLAIFSSMLMISLSYLLSSNLSHLSGRLLIVPALIYCGMLADFLFWSICVSLLTISVYLLLLLSCPLLLYRELLIRLSLLLSFLAKSWRCSFFLLLLNW